MKRRARAHVAAELELMRKIMLALGQHPSLKLWRQNVGQVPVRDRTGKVLRIFDAGPPNGAADLSGFISPEGWRLEIEVKTDTKRSEDQERWAAAVTAGGCVYVLADFDPALDLDANVRRAVDLVELAIAERRARDGAELTACP